MINFFKDPILLQGSCFEFVFLENLSIHSIEQEQFWSLNKIFARVPNIIKVLKLQRIIFRAKWCILRLLLYEILK
jgi:hypothetical protein